MERNGVETLRFIVRWREVEASEGSYEFSALDRIARSAARHRIDLLPFVYGSPAWVAEPESHPPIDEAADRRAWRRFLTALVARYGPGGELWQRRARRAPIRRWQIWNEPNFDFYWHPAPSERPPPESAREYGRLLRISAAAIRAADRDAEIVLGGLAPIASGVPWWEFLPALYRLDGIRSTFDVLALHPYAERLGGLTYQAQRARRIMRRAGDRATELAITEIGWASGGPRSTTLVLDPEGQAQMLELAFELLARKARVWRISDVDWYAWQDTASVEPGCGFCAKAGLIDLRARPKPSLRAYARVTAGPPARASE